METEGEIGAFNRAQRALQNFGETFPLFVIMYLLASFVFPFYAFVVCCCYMAAKAIMAVGYTSSADGRMGGTMLSLVANCILEGMVLMVGVKATTA
jgi:uncharacterized MAPEG superfamily protein